MHIKSETSSCSDEQGLFNLKSVHPFVYLSISLHVSCFLYTVATIINIYIYIYVYMYMNYCSTFLNNVSDKIYILFSFLLRIEKNVSWFPQNNLSSIAAVFIYNKICFQISICNTGPQKNYILYGSKSYNFFMPKIWILSIDIL